MTRRALARDERGATAVEFAFVGGILIILILGIVDLSRYMITIHSLRTASAEGARAGLVALNTGMSPTQNCPALGTISTATIAQKTPFLSVPPLTVSVSVPSGCSTRLITSTATYPFTFVAPLFPGSALSLSRTSQLPF